MVVPNDNNDQSNMEPIPEMMFAAGEEPVGVRVLTYQSSRTIKRIVTALNEDEITAIRASTFGKIIEIADKPSFSGRFARYLMSRQLRVKKKHEVWFRFAGQPIRFSLREFAIVTGLPCGMYPPKSKMKLKETITEKPYWPALFGKVEVVTVSSVIKMLRRRTVTDQETRIKFACLAILTSVLLPTSLNMKISREHAEAIEDLEEFFSYPWGRLAFEMLMGSIKERDEITLSQNTIAVKGFALALQLVLVEAVPSLTEVVQDTGSSSESDSADEIDDRSDKLSKKQTLSPAHARNIDKKSEVFVKSIIDEDRSRPLDANTLVWSDEVDDELVDNLVKLINGGYKFHRSMFLGGATKTDVQKMRDELRARANKRKCRKAPASSVPVEIENIEETSGLYDKIKPELLRIDGNVSYAMRAVEDLNTKMGVLQGSIKTDLEVWFEKLKGEMESHITVAVKKAVESSNVNRNVPINTPELNTNTGDEGNANDEFYHTTIRNVMSNIEQYTTPPRQSIQYKDDTGAVHDNVGTGMDMTVDDHTGCKSSSATSHTHMRKDEEILGKDHGGVAVSVTLDAPNFSLGLTQQEKSPGVDVLEPAMVGAYLNVANAESEENDEVEHIYANDENIEEAVANNIARKSKRQKTFPSNLMADYECGHGVVAHGRISPISMFVAYEREETIVKYDELVKRLLKAFVINVAGLSVTDKDLKDIAERSRPLNAKVVDIVTRLVRCIQSKAEKHGESKRDVFFDTKFAASVARNYPKFAKSKLKKTHVFPKGTSDFLCSLEDTIRMVRRFYLPFNFDKKHWVGVCINCETWTIYVLDCNTSMKSDKDIVKDLTPMAETFLYLLRQACGSTYEGILEPMVIERAKGIFRNTEPGDSGMAAFVLMWNHSVGDMDRCRAVNADHVAIEAKAAAVMAYDFHEELNE